MSSEVWCKRQNGPEGESREAIPKQVFRDELDAIRARRKHVGISPPGDGAHGDSPTVSLGLNGLAISGGGIRSATFALGVLQAFARKNVLRHMDYLSTVSGGGYVGSSLTWALYGQSGNREFIDFIDSFDVGANFPVGTEDPRAPAPLERDSKRSALLHYLREHGKYLTPGAGIGMLSAIGVLLRGVIDTLMLWIALTTAIFALIMMHFGAAIFGAIEVFVVAVGIGVLNSMIYSLATFVSLRGGRAWQYGIRRLYERLTRLYLVVTVTILLIVTLAPVHAAIAAWANVLSPAMVLSGTGAGLWTYLQSGAESGRKPPVPLGLIATLGAALFIYGALLGSYMLATHIVSNYPGVHAYVLPGIALLFVYGWFCNSNYLSLHRYYRDRLMEAFLPEIGRAIAGKTGASYPANSASISDMWDPEKPRGPYHIINTNVVLVDSDRRRQRSRGGENFILSPFYCGSDSTAWRKTKDFELDNMTLATAMAISGAAANPNAGVGGKGVTRNRWVSLLMALLNLRLGYWVRHPVRQRAWWWPPNHFHPGLYELVSSFKETKPWLQLTDGGHFENLALYELIRRRMKLIVVLDGGADPEFNFSDLQTASRRIAEDFGTRIRFSETAGPGELTYDNQKHPGRFPSHPGRAERKYITATIEYPGNERGTLIYVKTTMVKGLSVECQGYKDANPLFPDQSTADQFFDPEQFEAYRELGYVIGLDAADEVATHVAI